MALRPDMRKMLAGRIFVEINWRIWLFLSPRDVGVFRFKSQRCGFGEGTGVISQRGGDKYLAICGDHRFRFWLFSDCGKSWQ
jgi:hypothetical protein